MGGGGREEAFLQKVPPSPGSPYRLLLNPRLFFALGETADVFAVAPEDQREDDQREGQELNLPESASRMGMDVTRASEPSETKPERQIRNRQMQTAMRSCQNAAG